MLYELIANTSRQVVDTTVKPARVSAPRPYLTGIFLHLEPYPVLDYAVKPTSNMNLLYQGTAPIGTDIDTGDILTKMVLVVDGVTPWPGAAAPQNSPNQQWVVSLAHDSQPGPGAHRILYVTRVYGGGPAKTNRG